MGPRVLLDSVDRQVQLDKLDLQEVQDRLEALVVQVEEELPVRREQMALLGQLDHKVHEVLLVRPDHLGVKDQKVSLALQVSPVNPVL